MADLLPLLRLNRAALIQWFTPSTCNLCGRRCETEEDRERLLDPAFCTEGGAWAQKDHTGKVVRPAVQRCPHKESQ